MELNTRDSAKECYDRGLMTKYPIGCIYGDHRKGAFYENITFAVAENREDKWNKHLNSGSSWACRDNGCNDSLGESMCGGTFLTLNEHNAHVDQEHPTFKRMVKWLKSQNMDIHIWDGEKPVLYEGE